MIYLNDEKIEVKKFPNCESLINSDNLKIIKDELNKIKFKFEGDEDITHLIFLKGHLDELRVKSNLEILYMPYSRMDRTEGMTVFTLKYLCKLINSLEFEEVLIYEPHSDVCIALLDRVKVINMTKVLTEKLLNDINGNKDDLYIVYPDAGAAKRYGKQIKYDRVLTANKERDFKTGFINKLEINGEVKGKEFRAVIADDLCSKGGTFILTAEKLKEMGAVQIYLVVTHCEDTIFHGDILKSNLITKVYTTDSILSKEHEKLDIMKVI